jgi:hypothetical protein
MKRRNKEFLAHNGYNTDAMEHAIKRLDDYVYHVEDDIPPDHPAEHILDPEKTEHLHTYTFDYAQISHDIFASQTVPLFSTVLAQANIRLEQIFLG